MTTAATEVPVRKIKVREGFNVREQDGADAGLVRSIRARGVLVPLILEPNRDGYYLVAGHRRLAAAKAAGLGTVPAVVRAASDEEREAVAAAENISRSQLSAVEEAIAVRRLQEAGLTEQGVRDTLGVSAKWLAERKLILRLPERTHDHIAAGYVGSKGLRTLVGLGEVSERLRDAVIDHCIAEQRDGYAWRLDGWAIQQAVREVDGFHPLPGRSLAKAELAGLGLDDERLKKAAELAEAGYGHWRPDFTEAQLDAARAAGVLWVDPEDEDSPGHLRGIVCDGDFYRQMVADAVDRAHKRLRKRAPAAKQSDQGKELEDGAKAERARLREQIAELQATARAHNEKLGRNLLNGLARVELTDDVAAVLTTALVHRPPKSAYYSGCPQIMEVRELAGRGLRYLLPDFQRQVTKGKRSVTEYLEGDELVKRGRAFLDGGKTPGERVGRLVIAMVASRYAIERVLPRSRRIPSRSLGDQAALARIAKPHLPRGLEATNRRLERAEAKLAELLRR